MKRILLSLVIVLAAMAFLTCTGCGKRKPPPPPVIVQAPNYKPIGEGMKVQSYALIAVAVAVILAIALMSKSKNP